MRSEFMQIPKLLPNNFNATKIKQDYLLIGGDGSHALLSPNEFKQFISNKIDIGLYEKLENANLLITKKTKQKIIENYRKKFSHIFEHASTHQIIINYGSQAISRDQAEKIIDFILQSPSENLLIEFVGDEPLRNFDEVRHIVNYIKSLVKNYKKEFNFRIYSGLSFFNDLILNFLINEKFQVSVRLDGPSEVHNHNSFYKECWNDHDDVTKKIKLLRNSVLPFEAYPVITKKSLYFYDKIINEYLKFNFKKIRLEPLLPLNYRDNEVTEKFFTDEEFFYFYKRSIGHIIDNDFDIIENSTQNALLTLSQISNKGLFDIVAPTKEAANILAYDFDGFVYPSYDAFKSDKEIFQLGNVEISYTKFISSKQFKDFVTLSINTMHLNSHNAFSPYFGLSPVASYASHRSLIPITPIDFWCNLANKIYHFIFEGLYYKKNYNTKFQNWLTAK